MQINIIYDKNDESLKEICNYLQEKSLKYVVILNEYSNNFTTVEYEKYFLYLNDVHVKNFLKINNHKEIDVAILPNSDAINTINRYGINKNISDAIDDALNENLSLEDELLLCNEEVSFKKISVGNVQDLSKNYDLNFVSNIKNFFKNLKNLKYQTIELSTKNTTIKKALSGILILEDYTIYSNLSGENSGSFHDGKLNIFLIAPFSIISYLLDLITIFIYHKFNIGNLPKNIGFINTQFLEISSHKSFDFSVDDITLSTKQLQIKLIRGKLKIHYGSAFKETIQKLKINPIKNKNEIIDIKNLPKGDIENLLVDGNIPIFKKSDDEDIKEALLSLNKSAKTTSIFITLMILSTLLATVGLFQDSTPSVIGAMVLAPLMAPIISLAMGFTRNYKFMINQSLKTLTFGIFCALFFSALFTLFMPLEGLNSQIESRINPNLLDLFVAIFSGIAGAYASSKEEVAKSLAGVAIAVALVPPLAVTGIGLAWFDLDIIFGSFLLFLTNLFGMILAASLTFIVLGFAPVYKAKKGLAYSSLFLTVICIPLVLSFYSLVLQNNDYSKLSKIKNLTINEKNVKLRVVKINKSQKELVNLDIEIISKEPLNIKEYKEIKEYFQNVVEKKVVLNIIPEIIVQ